MWYDLNNISLKYFEKYKLFRGTTVSKTSKIVIFYILKFFIGYSFYSVVGKRIGHTKSGIFTENQESGASTHQNRA